MSRPVIIVILVFGLLVTASILGTQSLSKRLNKTINDQAQRLEYQEAELNRARSALNMQARTPQQTASGPVFSGTSFDDQSMRGVTILSDTNAFQRATFRSANLVGATLQGGGSSFQYACFDQAQMKNARLTGGASSFQLATFVAADLTGASLQGNFQGASFEKSNLAGATWAGSFQGCNISGAQFAGANLVKLRGDDLESCNFSEAPTYDSETKFPPDFDPDRQGWKLTVP